MTKIIMLWFNVSNDTNTQKQILLNIILLIKFKTI